MTNKKFTEYVELFSKFYYDEKIRVHLGKDSVALRPVVNLEDELKKIDNKFTEKEFVEVAFNVLRLLRDLSLGITPKDDKKTKIVKEKFGKDKSILEHFRVHTSSSVNTYEDVDYEISTKRSKENPSQIIGTSIIVSIMHMNPMKPETTERFVIELTKKELHELIRKLSEVEEAISKL